MPQESLTIQKDRPGIVLIDGLPDSLDKECRVRQEEVRVEAQDRWPWNRSILRVALDVTVAVFWVSTKFCLSGSHD
jgi:hypothetical protein